MKVEGNKTQPPETKALHKFLKSSCRVGMFVRNDSWEKYYTWSKNSLEQSPTYRNNQNNRDNKYIITTDVRRKLCLHNKN
jgi:hypothetical protein